MATRSAVARSATGNADRRPPLEIAIIAKPPDLLKCVHVTKFPQRRRERVRTHRELVRTSRVAHQSRVPAKNSLRSKVKGNAERCGTQRAKFRAKIRYRVDHVIIAYPTFLRNRDAPLLNIAS
jgi:hypothetical protein